MINVAIEREIVSELLREPKLVTEIDCQAEWFLVPMYQELFVCLELLKGEASSLFDIFHFLKQLNPHTTILFKDLVELENNVVTTSQIKSHVLSLHQAFLTVSLKEVCQQGTTDLSESIKEEMKNLLSQMERLTESKESGDLEKTFQTIDYSLNHDGDSGVKTFPNLDYKLGGGLYGGMLVTIGARPGVGKTAFATINLVEQAIKRNKEMAVDIFTLEMNKKELVNRFVSLKTGISTNALRRPNQVLLENEKEAVKQTLDELRDYNLKVFDTASTIQSIKGHIKARIFDHGRKPYMAVIDYLGLIRISGGHKDRRLEIEAITRELKILANELNIVIVLLSQLSRGVEYRQDKTPILSDLRESGSIEQDSNVVAFLHQPVAGNPSQKELVIRKNREGTLGILRFHFDGAKMLFEPVYQ